MPARFRFTPVAIPPTPAPTTATRGVRSGPNSASRAGFTAYYPSTNLTIVSQSLDFDLGALVGDRLRQRELLPRPGRVRRPVRLLRLATRPEPRVARAEVRRLHGDRLRRSHGRVPRPGHVLVVQHGRRSVREVLGAGRG